MSLAGNLAFFEHPHLATDKKLLRCSVFRITCRATDAGRNIFKAEAECLSDRQKSLPRFGHKRTLFSKFLS